MEKLDQQIAEKEVELAKLRLEKLTGLINKHIKSLDEITDEEKIAWFDKTWQGAYDEVMQKVNEGEDYYENDDTTHWAWEAYLEILGKDIFKLYNRTDLGDK